MGGREGGRVSLSTVRAALRGRIGRRGAALLFFAMLDVLYAGSMATAQDSGLPLNATYSWFGEVLPLTAWALLWLSVGLICAYHAFRHYDRFGFVAAIGIKVVWAILSFTGWLVDDVTLGSVAIWLGLAGLVWVISGWAEPPDPDLLPPADTGEDDSHAHRGP